jgi:trehalose 6-phosphate phosphatase
MLRGVAATPALLDPLLNQLRAAPEQAALFLDFDGVLAPIVDRPEQAYPPAETRRELERLTQRYGLVSVVSGRAGQDVRERVAVDGIVYVGSHGLELDRQADRWRQQIADFASSTAWPDDELERKGLSVAFHFRNRDDEARAIVELEAIADQARDDGLMARFGRKVLEVLPPVGSNKGTAVRQLLAGAGYTRALVAGDDTTDLDAFRAVEELEHKVRVAVLAEESPPLLAEHAELVLSGTGEFLELLRQL